MSEVFTVFFSWQSDTPRRNGRDLVRDALDRAADAIGRDPSSPFRVLVQSDTENEPGLCNIPETILRRLRESDAVVSDLTFVASTTSTEPKHCSNPNVLFELGYSFAKLGPERLICVMNEAHGPTAKQIFDLAHHRRPIAFCCPKDGKKRSDVVASLSATLESAIRDVMKLGLTGGFGGDDEIMHQRQLSEIESFWHSTGHRKPDAPRISVWFRPSHFRPKRWTDAGVLEALLQTAGPQTDRFHRYPPQQKGIAPMDWGIYNDTYGDPWALTYAGQFWMECAVGGWEQLRLSERDRRVSPEPPEDGIVESNHWVSMNRALSHLSYALQLARNLTEQFGDGEPMRLGFEASNTRGRWLRVDDWYSTGPSRAPSLRREFDTSARDLREGWIERFVDIAKEYCDLFSRDGRVLSRADLKQYAMSPGSI